MDFLLIPLNSSTYGIPTWIPLLQFLKQTDTKYLCTTEKFTWCRTWSHSWLLLLIILYLEINKCHCLRRQKKYAALIPPNIVIACCCRMFTDSCKRMRIMKSSEAIGLGMGFLSFLVPFLFLFFFLWLLWNKLASAPTPNLPKSLWNMGMDRNAYCFGW